MKKFQILITALLFSASAATAAETALKIELKDGHREAYVLSSRPSVTFEGELIKITTADASASFARSEVAAITFGDNVTNAVSQIEDKTRVLSYINSELNAPGSMIEVYAVDGTLVASAYESLTTTGLSTGIYIVRAGAQTLKIAIK